MEQQSLIPEIKKLSVAERIIIAEQIWDTIVADQESLPVTDAQKDELDRRIEAYHVCPQEGNSWESIKSKLIMEK